MPRSDQTRAFLEAITANVPEHLHFYLWTLPHRRSRWYRVGLFDAAVSYVEASSNETMDFYVGAALADADRGPNRRVQPSDAAGLFGLWLDVDFGSPGEGHKKPNLPPDEAAARTLLADALPAPSILVHSGHGLQAWWLLDEPWVFADEEQRALAAGLEQAWNQHAQRAASERGWTVDSVHDLSRVMRLPGTTNHKGEPKPVEIVDMPGTRYEHDRLREIVGHPRRTSGRVISAANSDQYVQDVGPFELRGDASPPFDRWEQLKEVEPRVERSWRRERRDLQDQSPSGYDLSMATVCRMAGWPDQEIVDLLIAARRHNGEDTKLQRPDYYARTLMRARETAARSTAAEDLEEVVDRLDQVDDVERGQVREQALEQISASLGVRIIRVIRFTQDPPKYKLVTPSGSTTLTSQVMLNQNQFRAKMMEATDIIVPRFKGPQWDRIVQSILRVKEDVDTGEEATELGAAHQWLADYMLDHPPAGERDEHVLQMQVPYRDEDDRTVIFGPAFRRWLNMVRGEKVSAQQMGMMLRSMGAEPRTEMVMVNGKRTSRSAWRLPGSM